jgi:cytosine/adenosine deaminase-related metal-dependent hydrolase
MIVIPGFVDTHRHMWEGQIRQVLPDIDLPEYLKTILGRYGTAYRPEDAYIGDLVSALSALDAGVTTLLDWSHIQTTPEHTDAVVKALKDAGVRAVFAYGMPQIGKPWWTDTSRHQYPGDIARLRKQYFSSDDQLLTLGLAASGGFGNPEIAAKEWAAARAVDARVTIHLSGKDAVAKLSQGVKLGADTTYVHCGGWSDAEWKMVADSGGTVSFSPGTELVMGIINPPIQQALDVGIRPSLSADAETNAPNDMFTEMRLALASQNAMRMARRDRGEQNLPKRLTVRDALEFATVEGAKANGLEGKVGSLTPGKQADIVLLRKDRINVLPVNDAIGAVVLGMDTSNVDTVFVAGQAKKRNGQLVGVDLKRIAEEAMRSRDYLAAKAKAG